MYAGYERLYFKKGETIFSQGDSGDCAYLVESGEIEISILDEALRNKPISILSTGELFGEIALIDYSPRTASAKALADTILIQINRQLVEDKLQQTDPVVEHLLRISLDRLRSMHDKDDKNASSGPPKKVIVEKSAHSQRNAVQEISLASDIKEAIEKEQFELFYQPIISYKKRELAGYEALIRWPRAPETFTPPNEFLDVAETTGLIIPIGNWTLEQASRDYHRLAAASRAETPIFISVNLSAKQLSETGVGDNYKDIFEKNDVDIENIKLELTETVLVDKPEVAIAALTHLKSQGFKISLDDFGTGFSSLSHLQKFPVDFLKIDQTFVSNMMDNVKNMQIVSASILLAKLMDIQVIAEGIENQSEEKLLNGMNCDFGQGYFYAKPLRLEEAVKFTQEFSFDD